MIITNIPSEKTAVTPQSFTVLVPLHLAQDLLHCTESNGLQSPHPLSPCFLPFTLFFRFLLFLLSLPPAYKFCLSLLFSIHPLSYTTVCSALALYLLSSFCCFCSHSQSQNSAGERPVMSPGRVLIGKSFTVLTSQVEFCSFKQPLLLELRDSIKDSSFKLIRNAISALLTHVWVVPAMSVSLENTDSSYQQSRANCKINHNQLSCLLLLRGIDKIMRLLWCLIKFNSNDGENVGRNERHVQWKHFFFLSSIRLGIPQVKRPCMLYLFLIYMTSAQLSALQYMLSK